MTGPTRATRQHNAVTQALASTDRFKSAQEIYSDLRAGGDTVGLTTVYRHLQALATAGSVDVLRADDGETLYRFCGTDAHHHHLVCRSCGVSIEVKAPSVERWAAQIGAEHGFTELVHDVEIFGTCRKCQR